jgi:hypothetical protein
MRLLINGTSLPVGQLGPDFLLLKTPLDHPPTDATIVLCVDGNERRWNVHIPEGISAGSRRVVIAGSGLTGEHTGVAVATPVRNGAA